MKLIYAFLLAAVLGGTSHASTIIPQQVQEVAMDTDTVKQVLVSSFSCVQVDSAPVVNSNRRVLELENLDSTNSLRCTHTNVGSDACTRTYGHEVKAGTSWTLSMAAWDRAGSRLSDYCISTSSYAISVALTQLN